ncbi:hypothetical protein VTL71DRAFT_1600 [Oculimacula yallundae]|uniref:Uncharacterized protein n=1 Tax=Oculimacula yallundae TaxID=86028 RepID=A0ABR4CCH5_9HELO
MHTTTDLTNITTMTTLIPTTPASSPRPSYRKHTRALSRDLGFKTIPMFEMPMTMENTIPENTMAASGSYTNLLTRARGISAPPPPPPFLKRSSSWQ